MKKEILSLTTVELLLKDGGICKSPGGRHTHTHTTLIALEEEGGKKKKLFIFRLFDRFQKHPFN
jgi:hypothetical protein